MAVNRELGYDVNDILGNQSLGGFTDENLFGEDTLDPTNFLLLGATQRTSTAFGRTATVKAGEDIRPALESLKSAGGGTLILLAGVHKPSYDIVGGSNINIVGEGRNITIIEFGGSAVGIKYIGTSGEILENFRLTDLTVQNSNNTAGIDIDFADFWRMENVRVTSCDQDGIRIQNSQNAIVSNVRSDTNTSDGFLIFGNSLSTRGTYILVSDCLADGNTAAGFKITASSGNRIKIQNCVADSNGSYGFQQSSSVNSRVLFEGCRAISNTSNGFLISGDFNRLVGCSFITNTGDGLNISGLFNVVVAAEFGDGITVSDERNVITASAQLSPQWHKENKYFYNRTGGTLAAGAVVVYDVSNNADTDMTTTTTQGDDLVVGMNVASAADTERVNILTEGKTTVLKVDGTTDIAVGDFLCTSTTAGIAQKAAAGDMAFAIALEAYTTDDSNGVIDALIIKPRKI